MAKTPKGRKNPSSESRPPIMLRDGTQVGSTLPSHFPKGKALSARRVTSYSKKTLDSALDKANEDDVEDEEDDEVMEDMKEEGRGGEEDYDSGANRHAPTNAYPPAYFPQPPAHFPHPPSHFPQPPAHFLPQEYFAQMPYPHSSYNYLPPPQPYPYPLQNISPQQLPPSLNYQFQFTPQEFQPTHATTVVDKKGKGRAIPHNGYSQSNNASYNPSNTTYNTNNNPSSNSSDTSNDTSNNTGNNLSNSSNNNTNKDNNITYHDPSHYDPNTSNGLIKKKVAKVVSPVPTIADAFKSIASSPASGARTVSSDVASTMASAPTTHVEPLIIPQPLYAAATATTPEAPILGVGHLPIPTTGQSSTAVGQPASPNGNGGTQFYTLNDGTFFSMGGNQPSQYEDKTGNTVLSCRHHWGFKGHRLCQGTDAEDYNCLICLNKTPLGDVKPWSARCLSWKVNAPNPLPEFDCCPFIRAVRRQRCILGIFPTGIIPADFLAVWQEWCKAKSTACATTSSQPALANVKSTHSEYPSLSRSSKALNDGVDPSTQRLHVVEDMSDGEDAISWQATDDEQYEHVLRSPSKKRISTVTEKGKGNGNGKGKGKKDEESYENESHNQDGGGIHNNKKRRIIQEDNNYDEEHEEEGEEMFTRKRHMKIKQEKEKESVAEGKRKKK